MYAHLCLTNAAPTNMPTNSYCEYTLYCVGSSSSVYGNRETMEVTEWSIETGRSGTLWICY